MDTDYESTEFDSSKARSRSISDSNTKSTEAEDLREGNYLLVDEGCRPNRFAKAKESVTVAIGAQFIDE